MTEKALSPLLQPHKAAGMRRKGHRWEHTASAVESCILRDRDRGRTCRNCEYCKPVIRAQRTKFLCTFTGEFLA